MMTSVSGVRSDAAAGLVYLIYGALRFQVKWDPGISHAPVAASGRVPIEAALHHTTEMINERPTRDSLELSSICDLCRRNHHHACDAVTGPPAFSPRSAVAGANPCRRLFSLSVRDSMNCFR